MRREYYFDSIEAFLGKSPQQILGELFENSLDGGSIESTQRDAWMEQIRILSEHLPPYRGRGAVFFEFSIPRLGKRIDAVAIIDGVIFVIEFKVGEREFTASAMDQVWDYALDLKNFHEPSHAPLVAPVLVATRAPDGLASGIGTPAADGTLPPIKANNDRLGDVIADVLRIPKRAAASPDEWRAGRYRPTPTIIEAAMALYKGHSVEDISRRDADAINLSTTSEAIAQVIEESKMNRRKSICFVTGVPGAGKTLVGLNIATEHIDKDSELYSVFLSGNGPLVAILREALARDKVQTERMRGQKVTKSAVMSEVKMFIQNVHNFRDDCLIDTGRPPIEHIAIFDEAQRAWNLEQTSAFMLRKKKRPNFDQSEPQFLISTLDRHRDWAVIVCLVGGGQEINTGEAGISEWVDSLNRSFPDWDIHISSRLTDSEYAAGEVLRKLESRPNVRYTDDLHLGVSMRSFRAEHVSYLVKQLLDLDDTGARQTLKSVAARYPIYLSRDLRSAKQWVKQRARGSERFGLVASSQAQRLKPHAIDVRSPMDPVHWFLDGKEDVRSSYYLEDVATEFHVQGLELDWACVTWDADFRFTPAGWEHWSFCGDRWNRIRKLERQSYLKNAYRVLLTRARQGMVIFVPQGDAEDPTRRSEYYDATYDYLRSVGFDVI
jgi:hypothetical protein